MTRLASLTSAALMGLIAFSLAACAKGAPASGATAKVPPPAETDVAADVPAVGEAEGQAVSDPTTVTMADVTSNKVVSVRNSMGDRINIESMSQWPPILGINEWKVSFKASKDAPMDLVDHLAIEVTMEGQRDDSPPQNASYNGGQSGGTLTWSPDQPGTYLITTRVMRKNQETGLVQFKVEVPAADPDPASTSAPETPDAPADPEPIAPPDAPAE